MSNTSLVKRLDSMRCLASLIKDYTESHSPSSLGIEVDPIKKGFNNGSGYNVNYVNCIENLGRFGIDTFHKEEYDADNFIHSRSYIDSLAGTLDSSLNFEYEVEQGDNGLLVRKVDYTQIEALLDSLRDAKTGIIKINGVNPYEHPESDFIYE